jgi:hypothetical protein
MRDTADLNPYLFNRTADLDQRDLLITLFLQPQVERIADRRNNPKFGGARMCGVEEIIHCFWNDGAGNAQQRRLL